MLSIECTAEWLRAPPHHLAKRHVAGLVTRRTPDSKVAGTEQVLYLTNFLTIFARAKPPSCVPSSFIVLKQLPTPLELHWNCDSSSYQSRCGLWPVALAGLWAG